jgi:hypothetical protein
LGNQHACALLVQKDRHREESRVLLVLSAISFVVGGTAAYFSAILLPAGIVQATAYWWPNPGLAIGSGIGLGAGLAIFGGGLAMYFGRFLAISGAEDEAEAYRRQAVGLLPETSQRLRFEWAPAVATTATGAAPGFSLRLIW